MTTTALQAPVTGSHAATIRSAYLIAGALRGLPVSAALEAITAAPLAPALSTDDYLTARSARRQDAAVLRVLLRAQQDLAHAMGTTTNGEDH